MSVKSFFEDAAVWFGLGALYRHERWHNPTNGKDQTIRITGPFHERAAATSKHERPVMFYKSVVEFHRDPPRGVLPPSEAIIK